MHRLQMIQIRLHLCPAIIWDYAFSKILDRPGFSDTWLMIKFDDLISLVAITNQIKQKG